MSIDSVSAPVNLTAIRARLESAQPGKWLYGRHGRTVVCDNDAYETFVAIAEMRHPSPWQRISDGNFIASAPGDIAALLAEVATLQEALKPFAEAIAWLGTSAVGRDDQIAPSGLPITLGDLRRVRNVLGVSRLTEEPQK